MRASVDLRALRLSWVQLPQDLAHVRDEEIDVPQSVLDPEVHASHCFGEARRYGALGWQARGDLAEGRPKLHQRPGCLLGPLAETRGQRLGDLEQGVARDAELPGHLPKPLMNL